MEESTPSCFSLFQFKRSPFKKQLNKLINFLATKNMYKITKCDSIWHTKNLYYISVFIQKITSRTKLSSPPTRFYPTHATPFLKSTFKHIHDNEFQTCFMFFTKHRKSCETHNGRNKNGLTI